MEKEENIILNMMHKYITTIGYVSAYPAIIIFIDKCLNINLHPIFNFYCDVIYGIFFFLSFQFIPALLWILITKFFKRIHPLITLIYFSLFVIWQLVILGYMLLIWLICYAKQ